jgi:Bacterial regulatory protein, Fis family/TIR domain
MKVFISWSGERSKAVAEALRYWLPNVIQALEPWMSADDIDKGTRWRSGIANELERSSVGIICLTRENLDSTWIHFEAGALSKQQQSTLICTLLIGVEPTDVLDPLAQFQHTRASKEDLRKLLSTINNTLDDLQRSDSQLNESFEVWWPKLEERLNSIPSSTEGHQTPMRKDREILEEILGLIRAQSAAGDLRRNREKRQFADSYEIDDRELRGFSDFARTRHLSHGTLAEIEAEYIAVTLAGTKGNKAEAARILGISRKSLYERLARFPQLAELATALGNGLESDEDETKD